MSCTVSAGRDDRNNALPQNTQLIGWSGMPLGRRSEVLGERLLGGGMTAVLGGFLGGRECTVFSSSVDFVGMGFLAAGGFEAAR